MNGFFYVYVLVSQANETIHYTGITRDLEQRLLAAQPRQLPQQFATQAMANRNCHCF